MYIYASVTVNLTHLDCTIATALRQQKGQPGAGQCSPAALYGHKMPPPRCAFRCAQHPSCVSVYSLCYHGHFSCVIELHGPDPVCRTLGRGTPASAFPHVCRLDLFMLFPSRMPSKALQFHWLRYFTTTQGLALISTTHHSV